MNPHDYLVPSLKSPLLIKLPQISYSLVCRRSSPFQQGTQRVQTVNSGFELVVYEYLLSLDLSCCTQWCFEALVLSVPEMILLPGAELSCHQGPYYVILVLRFKNHSFVFWGFHHHHLGLHFCFTSCFSIVKVLLFDIQADSCIP